MADPAWRAAAATGKGAEWDELQRLDAAIVPHEGADETDGLADLPAGLFDPAASPAEYDSMGQAAAAAGLELDPVEETALREGLHAAGVDRDLARTLHQAALASALYPVSPEEESARHDKVSAELRGLWGANYEKNLRMANDEARAIFEFMPARVRAGRSFREYITDLGLGNNKQVIQSLLMRAQHRARR